MAVTGPTGAAGGRVGADAPLGRPRRHAPLPIWRLIRAGIAAMIQRVDRALQQMRRERAPITSAAVARRADVSRSFLYQNADARALVTAAAAGQAKEADARASAFW